MFISENDYLTMSIFTGAVLPVLIALNGTVYRTLFAACWFYGR